MNMTWLRTNYDRAAVFAAEVDDSSDTAHVSSASAVVAEIIDDNGETMPEGPTSSAQPGSDVFASESAGGSE